MNKIKSGSQILVFLLIIASTALAQTEHHGQVLDAISKETIPFATLSYSVDQSGYGTTADIDGSFELIITHSVDSIMVSHLGYTPIYIKTKSLKKRNNKIYLSPHTTQIKEIVITGKKEKYSNRDNPAVELIRKVVDKKNENQIINYSPLEYRSHNKSLLAADGVSQREIKLLGLGSVSELMKDVEPNYFGSNNYLPIYFLEEISMLYAESRGPIQEQRLAIQDIELMEVLDHDKAREIRETIFSRINIYDDHINILGNQIMSPLNSLSPSFYKFFIKDTIIKYDRECIVLDFIPRNLYDLGFLGDLYISNDGKYQVLGVEMSLPEKANINFVDKISFTQSFSFDSLDISGEKKEIGYTQEDAVHARLKIYGAKLYGYSINTYTKPRFQSFSPLKDSELSQYKIDDLTRISPLTEMESKTYQLPDSLNKIGWFRVLKFLSESFYQGYFVAGPLAFGPLDNIYSFNSTEGNRFRFSGKTNHKFSRRLYANWMIAYGTKDKKFKYDFDIKYSFNTQGKNPMHYPAHYIGARINHNTMLQSRRINTSNYDRISHSITNIVDLKLAMEKQYYFEWYKVFRKGVMINPYLKFQNISPYGDWNIDNKVEGFEYNRLGLNFSIALNGKIIPKPRSRYKKSGNNTNLGFNYEYGFENTHLLVVKANRRLSLMPLGHSNIYIEGGRIWGEIPSPYLFINPTFNNIVYSRLSFNLMQPLEFHSDKFVQLMAFHNFGGFIFNKIPLIRRLKLREEINFKLAYGSLSEENQFMIDNNPSRSFDSTPYIETGVGIQNLFKIIGIDYIYRLTHQFEDKPNWGIRINLGFRF